MVQSVVPKLFHTAYDQYVVLQDQQSEQQSNSQSNSQTKDRAAENIVSFF